MDDLIERLNDAWRRLYADGDEHGVCDTIAEAAAALEAAREDGELAAKWRLCTAEHPFEGDEVVKCHINVGVNVWKGTDWIAFYECSPETLREAIDQARGIVPEAGQEDAQ